MQSCCVFIPNDSLPSPSTIVSGDIPGTVRSWYHGQASIPGTLVLCLPQIKIVSAGHKSMEPLQEIPFVIPRPILEEGTFKYFFKSPKLRVSVPPPFPPLSVHPFPFYPILTPSSYLCYTALFLLFWRMSPTPLPSLISYLNSVPFRLKHTNMYIKANIQYRRRLTVFVFVSWLPHLG